MISYCPTCGCIILDTDKNVKSHSSLAECITALKVEAHDWFLRMERVTKIIERINSDKGV